MWFLLSVLRIRRGIEHCNVCGYTFCESGVIKTCDLLQVYSIFHFIWNAIESQFMSRNSQSDIEDVWHGLKCLFVLILSSVDFVSFYRCTPYVGNMTAWGTLCTTDARIHVCKVQCDCRFSVNHEECMYWIVDVVSRPSRVGSLPLIRIPRTIVYVLMVISNYVENC